MYPLVFEVSLQIGKLPHPTLRISIRDTRILPRFFRLLAGPATSPRFMSHISYLCLTSYSVSRTCNVHPFYTHTKLRTFYYQEVAKLDVSLRELIDMEVKMKAYHETLLSIEQAAQKGQLEARSLFLFLSFSFVSLYQYYLIFLHACYVFQFLTLPHLLTPTQYSHSHSRTSHPSLPPLPSPSTSASNAQTMNLDTYNRTHPRRSTKPK